MKTLKLIGFIPAFFILILLLNLTFNVVVKIIGFDHALDAGWYYVFTKPFLIAAVSTLVTLEIYPNDKKKPAIIIVGIALLAYCLTVVYIANDESIYISAGQIWTMVVSFIGYFCASYYMRD